MSRPSNKVSTQNKINLLAKIRRNLYHAARPGASVLNNYIKKVFETGKRGDAREESYYPALKSLIEAFAKASGHSQVEVTSQPKRTEAGNPDFRIWDGKQHIVGYILGGR